jgi:hypothetical protein
MEAFGNRWTLQVIEDRGEFHSASHLIWCNGGSKIPEMDYEQGDVRSSVRMARRGTPI